MAEPTPYPTELVRFSRIEHAVHRTVAILMLVSIATAAVLYNGFLAVPIGHRRIVKLVHVYSGFALLVPIVVGVLSRTYRADLRRLNRFSKDDWRWLRSRTRRDGTIPVGKFNAGQKLNAALSTGGIIVLLATGTVMYYPDLVRLSWRTGASFVHDWFALAIGLLVAGHISYAMRDAESRRGMRTGRVSTVWARDHHGAWADEAVEAARAQAQTVRLQAVGTQPRRTRRSDTRTIHRQNADLGVVAAPRNRDDSANEHEPCGEQ